MRFSEEQSLDKARGYFVATSGNITDEVIMEYIDNQDTGNKDEDFTLSEGL